MLQGSCAGADAVAVVKQQQQFSELRVGNLEQELWGEQQLNVTAKVVEFNSFFKISGGGSSRARELALGVKRSIEDEGIATTHKSCTEE